MADPEGYVRIREAAIALFAERGIEGVSILDIAGAAGVSGGLIRHHFGSKEQLRQTCDQYVLDKIREIKVRNIEQMSADPGFVPTYDEETIRYYRYTGRATIDGSPAAADHFRRIVDETERWLVQESGHGHADPRGMAAVMTAFSIGALAMLDTFAEALDVDDIDGDLMRRFAAATAAVFTTPLIPPQLAQGMRALAEKSYGPEVDP